MSDHTTGLRAIKFRTFEEGILAVFPFVNFGIIAVLSHYELLAAPTLFFLGLATAMFWYLGQAFDLPRGKFFLVGGITASVVLASIIVDLKWGFSLLGTISDWLTGAEPVISSGGWILMTVAFGLVWLFHYIHSWSDCRVEINPTEIIIRRLGGETDSFPRIGTRLTYVPTDYTEAALIGSGDIIGKTRTGREIFRLKRVMWLYRNPIPFMGRTLKTRIDEMMNFQGTVLAEHEAAIEDDDHDDDGDEGDTF